MTKEELQALKEVKETLLAQIKEADSLIAEYAEMQKTKNSNNEGLSPEIQKAREIIKQSKNK